MRKLRSYSSSKGLDYPWRGAGGMCVSVLITVQLRQVLWGKLFLHGELFWKLCPSQFNNQKKKKKELTFLYSSRCFNIYYLITPPSFSLPILPSLIPFFFHSFKTNFVSFQMFGGHLFYFVDYPLNPSISVFLTTFEHFSVNLFIGRKR